MVYQGCSPCHGRSELSAAKRREGTIVEQEAESRHFGNSKTNNTIPTLVFHVVMYHNSLWAFCPDAQEYFISFHKNDLLRLQVKQLLRHKDPALVFKEARLVNACMTEATERSIVAASFIVSTDPGVRADHRGVTLNIC